MFDKLNSEKTLSYNLINKSLNIKEHEKVLISYSDCPNNFIELLIEEISNLKGIPVIYRLDTKLKRRLLLNSNSSNLEYYQKIVSPIMSSVDAVILINGSLNEYELKDIPENTQHLLSTLYTEPIHFKIRCSKKWVLLRYPTPSFAQACRMSTEKLYEYFYNVCNLDYSNLNNLMTPLKELIEKTDKVHIISKDTDLTFSIKNMPCIKCSGENNIPDGELYTAPIKDSVNGYITFNVPIIHNGYEYNDIQLIFKNGKIIDHDASNKIKFQNILDTDNGSRYLGEFAFGLNPYCIEPIKDILFDEKILGSIHLAIGSSYDDCSNGNKSAIHLDLIQKHLNEDFETKIFFDDTLIYKNGKFILPNLVALNQEKLI